MGAKKLTSLQLELLKVYSFNPSEEELVQIKGILGKFFAKRLISNVNTSIKENNISDEDLEKWLNE